MTLSDETLNIQTPENVAFGYPIAGLGSRFMACALDTIIILFLEVLIFLVILGVTNRLFTDISEWQESVTAWGLALAGLLAFMVFWGYYIFFEMIWNGQTPGKRLVGLRVIRTNGTPVTLVESMVRNLVRLVDLLPSFYGIGVVTMFIDLQSRRLGDLAAGTLVVHDRGKVTLAAVERSISSAVSRTSQEILSDWQLERLTPEELRLAESFLERREELKNRPALAEQIALALATRMERPEAAPKWPEAEGWLELLTQATYHELS